MRIMALWRMVLVMVVTMGISACAMESESIENNRISSEDNDFESRNDHPDFDDLSSFFDFDLIPSSESDRRYTNQYSSSGSNSESSDGRPRRNKYYYYYKADGPRYPFDPYPPQKQVVTPGTHYKPEIDKDMVENVNESKPTANQAVVGPYQVSVVDADSPLLANLGLRKEDLMKLSSHTKRSTTNASMEGSDSVPPPTYAENPRPDYPPPNYGPTHNHPHHHSHEPSNHYGGGHPERSYRPPSDYHPSENPPPPRGYGSNQPPPQGSYDPKSYHSSPPAYNYPPPPSSGYNQYSPPPSSYAPKRSSDVPWRSSPSAHTDWDDKQSKKPEPYHGYSHYQPPSHSSSPSRPSYNSENSGYRYASYSKPQSSYSSPSSSEYQSHKHSSGEYQSHKHSPSGSGDYHSHKHSPSSSGDYHSHKHSPSSDYHSHKHSPSGDYHSNKPSYSSSGYSSSSAKAPSRAGSYSAPSQEASKPGITIRFKGKAGAGHGGSGSSGHGGSGLSIPLNFNPLDVVKKLIPSLNPLNNKKVTIGITIENKKEPQIDFQTY